TGESLDLLRYVDAHFEGPALLPNDSAKREFAEELFTYTDTFNKTVYSSSKGDTVKEVGVALGIGSSEIVPKPIDLCSTETGTAKGYGDDTGTGNGKNQKFKILNNTMSVLMYHMHTCKLHRRILLEPSLEVWVVKPPREGYVTESKRREKGRRTFPSVSARDLSEEDLVIEAEIEGYLVRRIHVDEEASIEIM
ncbi:hypothetical protein Tco_0712066, partial [Tanacetum coccineum]